MKLNWGTSIAIVYITFATVMVGMVIKSKSFDHALVVDNYYEEDLKYQSHLNKLANSRTLTNDLTINEKADEHSLYFHFPKEFRQVDGKILLYRPDDMRKDIEVKIQPDEQKMQVVPTNKLLPGRWKVKVDWQGDGKEFFKEETIFL